MRGSVMAATASEPQSKAPFGTTGRAGSHRNGWAEIR